MMGADENNGNGSSSDPEMIKVVDRKGNVKVIPRSEYEAKKRSRKKHEAQQKTLPVKEIISIIFIIAAIVAASYFALHFVK
jgi:hypothetical protein